jgi:hypothetical protein
MAARINEAAGHLGSENGGPEIKMLNQGITVSVALGADLPDRVDRHTWGALRASAFWNW